ncbi:MULTISPECIES: ArsR/SmtB family transcription factor [Prauserella salsuginis group]|uniref:Rhodanese-related sulfurtransferase/DNA-binding HxlR family transcriptional regulator n=2 Tax=Prauserella salsuginis group TaxID=2893672 RepID=A0A839XXJ3_9PSEU|nr:MULTISPECIES: metalloregulator ArsR/SmtB family transcription factor [Prauserella salsuginis group]MBB3666074.1 rhodanese-related sulfurtransferase/DNA-binding HxlR family transcriptional regulator [Prauserella sediminis]MCR3718144.1 Rhodanese-related sulfurtransferase [Prauserella flava]MCR3732714.1 Rhodanese-related sulfurtransferase [Prauserella salsuginis]
MDVDKADLYDAVAGTGKALAHGKRLELLELLAQGERPVRELSRAAGLKLTTASAHLQILHDAGLVTTRKRGTSVLYRLTGADVAELLSVLCRVADTHRAEVESVRRAYLDTEQVRLVDREELLRETAEGRVLVLDVRPPEEYAAGHVPGAVSIPLEQLADRMAEIPPDVEVVAYCRGRYCVLSHDAVRLLHDSGREAALLEDGILEWRRDGMPITTAA